VVKRRGHLDRLSVIGADLQRQGALSDGWKHGVRLQDLRRPLQVAQAGQPGGGQDGRVHLPLLHLAQARVHVAAQVNHLQVRPQRSHLRRSPQAARADTRACRQIPQPAIPAADDGIAHVIALSDGGQGQALAYLRRHVL
jgi:hypothetical protein